MLSHFNNLFSIVNKIKHCGKDKLAFEQVLKADDLDKPYIRLFKYWENEYLMLEEELTFEESDKVIKALGYLYKLVNKYYVEDNVTTYLNFK